MDLRAGSMATALRSSRVNPVHDPHPFEAASSRRDTRTPRMIQLTAPVPCYCCGQPAWYVYEGEDGRTFFAWCGCRALVTTSLR